MKNNRIFIMKFNISTKGRQNCEINVYGIYQNKMLKLFWQRSIVTLILEVHLMDFGWLIEMIMQDADISREESIIISRNKSGDWNFNISQHSINKGTKNVAKSIQRGLFTLAIPCKDFATESYPSIYDTVLCSYLRAGLDEYSNNGVEKTNDVLQLYSFIKFIEDNISAFSHTTTDYIASLINPIATLHEICDLCMETNRIRWISSSSATADTIKIIEKAVYNYMHHESLTHVI